MHNHEKSLLNNHLKITSHALMGNADLLADGWWTFGENKEEQAIACLCPLNCQDLTLKIPVSRRSTVHQHWLPVSRLRPHSTFLFTVVTHWSLITSCLIIFLALTASHFSLFLSYCPCSFNLHLEEACLALLLPSLRPNPGPGPCLLARGSGLPPFWMHDNWIFYFGGSQDRSKPRPTSHYKSQEGRVCIPSCSLAAQTIQCRSPGLWILVEWHKGLGSGSNCLLQCSDPRATEGAISGNGFRGSDDGLGGMH